MTTAAIPSDSEDPSSSANGNSQVCIMKTSHRNLSIEISNIPSSPPVLLFVMTIILNMYISPAVTQGICGGFKAVLPVSRILIPFYDVICCGLRILQTEPEALLSSRHKRVFGSALIDYDRAEKQHHADIYIYNLKHCRDIHDKTKKDPDLQLILFGLFLSMYLVTVLGNLLIILAVISDSHLHTPMYFFLSNLSFSDICFISTMVPKMIVDIPSHSRVISYMDCLTQMTFYILFGCMDHMLLTVMGYDRFVAICYPLHYPTIMNTCSSVSLLLVSFLVSVLESQMHNMVALQITCFKDVEIANFFCEPSQI
ncbi:Olfactory receptor 7E24 [Fukomys damarensis]|uniref:Olfactory receptor 7E24 n=1 Tax=Fukomys damarensis TaxID=885580 RepID=A0A091E0U1_FUKDA|nr:Olfactory receptor 7E24 [Fukomys damarensis]